MSVVLVNPLWTRGRRLRGPVYNRVWPPLSLATAAAMIRDAGIAVSVVDANAERIEAEGLAERVRGAELAFVTSSTLDKWVCPNTELDPFLAAVEAVKQVVPRVVVVGVHGTVRPAQMLRATGAYAAVIGEPEATMRDLARGSREATPGVAYLENGALITTSPRPLLDLGALPAPAMELLPMQRYRYEVLGDHLMLLEATRGCPHGCRFCLRAMYGGRAFRRKPADNVCREIREAVLTHGVRSLYFIDIEFTIDRASALAVCDCMERLGRDVSWCCQTRADSLDEALLKRMRHTGCRLVHFGVESGSDRVLVSIRKGETTETIRRGVSMAQDAGMETACFFMFGFPGETPTDMEATVEFAKELAPTYASFHVLEPYPGTPMAEELGDAVTGDFFPFGYRFPGADLKAVQRRALLRYYLRPAYAVRRFTRGSLGMLARQIGIFADYLR
ncbi:radical SAM protein [Candidatus Fermentibacteria bacterium]|nr:radical SAM protein [Candidatus Fermentibacteria bacterium]